MPRPVRPLCPLNHLVLQRDDPRRSRTTAQIGYFFSPEAVARCAPEWMRRSRFYSLLSRFSPYSSLVRPARSPSRLPLECLSGFPQRVPIDIVQKRSELRRSAGSSSLGWALPEHSLQECSSNGTRAERRLRIQLVRGSAEVPCQPVESVPPLTRSPTPPGRRSSCRLCLPLGAPRMFLPMQVCKLRDWLRRPVGDSWCTRR